MNWVEQSAAHKAIRDITVAIFHMMFAMPALLSAWMLFAATWQYVRIGRWETLSVLAVMRDIHPHAFERFSGLAYVAANTPVWLASATLSLLIFVWAAQKND